MLGSVANSVFEGIKGINLHIWQTGIANFTGVSYSETGLKPIGFLIISLFATELFPSLSKRDVPATEQDVIGAFHSERGPQLPPYLTS